MTNEGRDGGQLPVLGVLVGGEGADGKFHNFSVANDGKMNVSTAGSAAGTHTITTGTGSGYTATTTSGTALAANANRKDAVISNYGTVGVFLARGATAVVGQGIYLAPNGGAYNITNENLYTGILTAIAASGTSTLAISEGT